MQHSLLGTAERAAYRLHGHMGRWQALALRVHEPDFGALVAAVRQAIQEVPASDPLADRLIARMVLNEILVRLVRRAGVDRQPDVAVALVSLIASCRSPAWVREALVLTDYCAQAVDRQNRPGVPLLVELALAALDTEYGNSQFNPTVFVCQLGTSESHLHRLLLSHTGRSLAGHLRHRRIAAARRSLLDTTDTIAAIATRVGFSGDTQLRRAFKSELGLPPSHVRKHADPRPGA